MTWRNPLYLQDPAVSYAAADDRFIIDTLFSEGVMNVAAGQGLAVQRPAGANMQVYVPPLDCIIDGDDATNQGAYLCRMTDAEFVTLTAPNTTNPRIDLLIAEVTDTQYKTASAASPAGVHLRVVAGTPAASPVQPALPATAIPLAAITVPANALSIVNANITDLRTQSGGAVAGVGFPAMTTTQRNAITNPAVGRSIFNTTTNRNETYLGSTIGWVAAAAVDVQTFTANGTWTKPANAQIVFLDVISGGGGGGGGSVSANTDSRGSQGGGGGGRFIGTFPASSLASSVSVTVGAGGTAGAMDQRGGDGGASVFGTAVTVTGGTGGINAAANPSSTAGNGGGVRGLLGSIDSTSSRPLSVQGGAGAQSGSNPPTATQIPGGFIAEYGGAYGAGYGTRGGPGQPGGSTVWGGGGGGGSATNGTGAGTSSIANSAGGAGGASGANPGGTGGLGSTTSYAATTPGSPGAAGNSIYCGSGGGAGGGGYVASSVFSSAGGAGGIPGGGGGGGGCSYSPGTVVAANLAGGAGARGEVRVLTLCV